MTEAEWNTCTDPQNMLEWLEEQASERKLRLFAVACCRRIWHLLTDERSRRAVEVGERFADDLANREELALACAQADRAHAEAPRHSNFRSLDAAPHVAEEDLSCSAADAAACAADAMQVAAEGDAFAKKEECRHQAMLLRCIFGPLPFRAVVLDPAWRTPTVKELATAIYEEKSFDRLPILADALEEAGGYNTAILTHCRQPGEHVRGCWALDLALGKE